MDSLASLVTALDASAATALKPMAEQAVFDPQQNTFRYDNGRRVYEGGAWTGGRLYYLPFSVLNHRQRTPVWDAMQLLLRGVILIIGDDAETERLTDRHGQELDATKMNTQQVTDFAGRFIPFRGITGGGPVKG